MVGIRQILQRRRAVTNISRLTRTMQIVSTAMFKSYYRKWQVDAAYYEALVQAGYLLVTSQTPLEHPLLKVNTSGRTAVLVIGSKAGLCGAYNANIWHLLETHLQMAQAAGKKLEVYAPASRLVQILTSRGVTPVKIYDDLDDLPTDLQIRQLADPFIDQYMHGQLDAFSLVYMGFHSPAHQQAQTMTCMPLTDLIDHQITRAKVIWPWEQTFEDFAMSPSPREIIESLAAMILHGAIRGCFLDAILSEHVARMVAMRAATKNAEDMIRDLSAQYNRERQTQITGELLDIISGMGALK
jgi:F-type H+-transporting ATPase subunit gamma